MLTSLKSCRSPCTWHCHHASERERRQEFIPPEMWPSNSPDLNPVDYSIWGMLQERVYRSQIHDVKELKKRLLREWKLLDHIVIAAAIAQCVVVWMHVFAWTVDILNINFEPLTFCSVLFVSSILVPLNVFNKHVQRANIVWNVLLMCLRLSHGMVGT